MVVLHALGTRFLWCACANNVVESAGFASSHVVRHCFRFVCVYGLGGGKQMLTEGGSKSRLQVRWDHRFRASEVPSEAQLRNGNAT
jgi:hypothetical protein